MCFSVLRKAREYEQAHLPFLATGIDRDILIAIGEAEDAGVPLNYKQLCLLDLASSATVRRRLARLIAGDIVKRQAAVNDGRSVILTISKTTRKAFHNYLRLFQVARKR